MDNYGSRMVSKLFKVLRAHERAAERPLEITELEDLFNHLPLRLSAAEKEIKAMAETMADIQKKLAVLAEDYAAMQGRVNSLVTGLQDSLGAARQAVADLTAQIKLSGEADLTPVGNALDALDAQVKAFQIPGVIAGPGDTPADKPTVATNVVSDTAAPQDAGVAPAALEMGSAAQDHG